MTNFCTTCGAARVAGARFCTQCGTSYVNEGSATTSTIVERAMSASDEAREEARRTIIENSDVAAMLACAERAELNGDQSDTEFWWLEVATAPVQVGDTVIAQGVIGLCEHVLLPQARFSEAELYCRHLVTRPSVAAQGASMLRRISEERGRSGVKSLTYSDDWEQVDLSRRAEFTADQQAQFNRLYAYLTRVGAENGMRSIIAAGRDDFLPHVTGWLIGFGGSDAPKESGITRDTAARVLYEWLVRHGCAQLAVDDGVAGGTLNADISHLQYETADDAYSAGIEAFNHNDLDEGRRLFALAEELGDERARLSNAGVAASTAGNLHLARQLLLDAVAKGCPRAMYNLGVMSREAGDLTEAADMFERSARLDYANGMYGLGILLYNRNLNDDAESWWRRASELGSPDAMYNLGVLLSERGLSEEAETWYRRAAEHGNEAAMNNIGVMLNSRGSLAEAMEFWERAATLGSDSARLNIEANRDRVPAVPVVNPRKSNRMNIFGS